MTDTRPRPDALGELLRAAQQGDAAAYAQLLGVITPRIRQIVRRRRGFAGVAETEDLVQDVLLSVHAVRATYDPARPFVPWLLAIVRHRLADGGRRYGRTARREVHSDDGDVTFTEDEANPDAEGLADAAALREAVQALPEAQRQAIELLKFEELSLKEAAALTGTSIAALKVATHRAIATLRRTLGIHHP
jgi:RNA polymerase sigma-70 factor (ECF subfamily)